MCFEARCHAYFSKPIIRVDPKDTESQYALVTCPIAPEVRGASSFRGLIKNPAGTLQLAHVVLAVFLFASPIPIAHAGDGPLLPLEHDAPAFTLQDSTGDEIALATHRGRNVLVHFFATWCEPCREELPALKRLVERADSRGLAVLAISVAEVPIRVRRFLGETPVNFPVLLDQDRAVAKSWGVDTLPTTFILDADLKPRLAVEREYDWDKLDLACVLEKLSKGGE
jgi:peroxiredoxin